MQAKRQATERGKSAARPDDGNGRGRERTAARVHPETVTRIERSMGALGTAAWWSSVAVIAVNLLLCLICMLKGKVMTGVIGVFVGVVALVGAIRLAKPGSWWATHRYASRPRRAARAARRYDERYAERWNRLRDLVAGAPSRE